MFSSSILSRLVTASRCLTFSYLTRCSFFSTLLTYKTSFFSSMACIFSNYIFLTLSSFTRILSSIIFFFTSSFSLFLRVNSVFLSAYSTASCSLFILNTSYFCSIWIFILASCNSIASFKANFFSISICLVYSFICSNYAALIFAFSLCSSTFSSLAFLISKDFTSPALIFSSIASLYDFKAYSLFKDVSAFFFLTCSYFTRATSF